LLSYGSDAEQQLGWIKVSQNPNGTTR